LINIKILSLSLYHLLGSSERVETPTGSIQHPSEFRPDKGVIDRVWFINTSPDTKVLLDFEIFLVKSRYSDCRDNYIKLYNSEEPSSSSYIGTYCNNQIPDQVKSATNKLLVVYHGTGDTRTTSFQFNWRPQTSSEPRIVIKGLLYFTEYIIQSLFFKKL